MHEVLVKLKDRLSRLGFEDASGLEAIRQIPGVLAFYVVPDPLLIEKLAAGERVLEQEEEIRRMHAKVKDETEKVATAA